MAVRFAVLLLLTGLVWAAPKKNYATAKGENEDLILTATIYLDTADIKEKIGSDLDGHYIMMEVKVDPKYGKDILVDRDDFVLKTDKDGERTKPFAGSQIAGRGALVLSEGDEEKKPKRKWSIGGPIMTGSPGEGEKGPTKDPKMVNSEEENPLKKVLDSKILPEGKTDQAVGGLLFFPMEKQKMKDLELDFGGKENRITLRFKP